MNTPSELKYTKTHEWVKVDGDTVTIGITDHAQSELGDVVFVELPEAGRILDLDASFGTVESVKTVSELYAPISGEILETNANLSGQPELVNSDPYEGGWLVKMKVKNPSDLDTLLDAGAYAASID